jgi:hypothetical protein
MKAEIMTASKYLVIFLIGVGIIIKFNKFNYSMKSRNWRVVSHHKNTQTHYTTISFFNTMVILLGRPTNGAHIFIVHYRHGAVSDDYVQKFSPLTKNEKEPFGLSVERVNEPMSTDSESMTLVLVNFTTCPSKLESLQ